jgi:hypothetical protein
MACGVGGGVSGRALTVDVRGFVWPEIRLRLTAARGGPGRMIQTMTWVGLDVHARSAHAAVVDAETGELRRARLGGDAQEVTRFLGSLRGPVRAVYEAGPTGSGLARGLGAGYRGGCRGAR